MDLFLNIVFLISPNFYRILSTIPLLVPCQQQHTLTMAWVVCMDKIRDFEKAWYVGIGQGDKFDKLGWLNLII